MIQHPAVISLLLSSFMISAMCIYATYYGIKIISKWDMGSGSEIQLDLERRTYLISTLLGYTLLFEIISFFLLIYTADSIHNRFTGAMCAAGSLGANSYGYPLLLVKLLNAVLCGIWLAINRIDSLGYDYPLIKRKYAGLALLSLLILVEAFLQYKYFSGLKADLITSCCGSLFSTEKRNLGGELASIPARPAMFLFAASYAIHLASGIYSYFRNRGALFFAGFSALFFLVALSSIISFISLYFYELPTHHCPFCILQKEYLNIGYILYGCLIAGVISGVSTGLAERFRGEKSLAAVIPGFQKISIVASLLLNSLFTIISLVQILRTPFRL